MIQFRPLFALILVIPCVLNERPIHASPDASDYERHIKPLLKERCYACHGALEQEAGLRVDTVELMLRGGDSGPVVIQENPSDSLLLDRVAADDTGERMPPEHEGEPLSPEQIEVLRRWIAEGAPAPVGEQPEADPDQHWAFQPVIRPAVPPTAISEATEQATENPIDAFIAQRMQQQGIVPQGEASRGLLLRRLTLDLVGLPPTPQEIAAAESDPRPDWYARTVERLLTDPRHGQRWGRHWMDIWRYSDWWGLGDQLRNSQQHIWHWRDWIVASLNDDLPYDEMVRLMLAADELHPNDLDRLRATGYLARNFYLFNRHQWMDETVEHVSKGFLGLTVNCAKCHDHKYDPISHADYYAIRAFFEPYHVRTDMVPGQADLQQDGIPRAFDGWLEAPTYLFIRGEESQPDKSQEILPGVPEVLRFAPLQIQPLPLPAEAWQPGRRPWVAEALGRAAERKIAQAAAKLDEARSKLAAAEAVGEAELEVHAAEASLELARAEAHSLQMRSAAQHVAGSGTDEAARAAVRAEREQAAALARLKLAEAELRLQRAEADKRQTATEAVEAARQALSAAHEAVEAPGTEFTPLVGARWSATRFLNSSQDDPAVEFPSSSTGRRKALAEWITDRRNPLTARVAVNHIWTRHFGRPLVPTEFDFGRNGSPPTHPELLDWLAAELVESGWSMKHIHHLIVTSATYRRSSSTSGAEAALAGDPDNATYWRWTTPRMESQLVRDSILALSGELNERFGGPPVPVAEQADSRRRSIYFFHSNNERNPFLTMFDEALVKECYRREQSIVPQQALALANSRWVLDATPEIAERLSHIRADTKSTADVQADDTFIHDAFVLLLGREPRAAEQAACGAAMAEWRRLAESPDGKKRPVRAQLVWVLLNHHDFVTRR